LPLQAIAGLLGVPPEDRGKLFDWSNKMIGSDDPEFADYDALTSAGELMWYAMQLAARKAEEPGDDIVTTLVQADADGDGLSDAEFGMFVVTLGIAGNETTRNSITQGMMAFTDHPDQWELFKRQRPKTVADEIIRWATPITAFQRTALADTELGGIAIKKGQRVVMFYRSNLARMTIDIMFNAIADHMPDLTSAGDPQRLRSPFINGIKHWPVDYKSGCPVAH
jgi:cholest-4-en-3-one 26-monooxygenase